MAGSRSEHGERIREATLRNHLAADYSAAPGVVALGLRDPIPVVDGNEMLVRCIGIYEGREQSICIDRQEALTPYVGLDNPAPQRKRMGQGPLWLPHPDEMDQLKREAVLAFLPTLADETEVTAEREFERWLND